MNSSLCFRILVVSLILLTLSSSGAFAATYYVDATNGNDTFSGLSPAPQGKDGPWLTLDKVNKQKLAPGDSVLFKAGGFWRGGIVAKHSGAEQAPITYAAYGKGARPVISTRTFITDMDKKQSWSKHGENVWVIRSPGERYRMWFNNSEKFKAESLDALSLTKPWFHKANLALLYVYSVANPAEMGLKLEMPYRLAVHEYAMQFQGADHIVVKNLDFRGGNFATVGLGGADYIHIESCSIGNSADHYGVVGNIKWLFPEDANSEHVTITKCIVDSGMRLKYPYNPMNGSDGISARMGVSHWEISHSTFRDWYHNSIELLATDRMAPSSYHKIFNNRFFADNISYGRAFSTSGEEIGSCAFNQFVGNVVANTSVRNQIGGDNNLVAYNVIVSTRNIRLKGRNWRWGKGQGIVLETMFGGRGICINNKIYNNTIYDTDEAGIWIQGYGDISAPGAISGNEIVNNIIVNCGQNSFQAGKKFGLIVDSDLSISNNTIKNNLIYTPGVKNIILFHGAAMTVSQFNAKNNKANHAISGNIQAAPQFQDVSKSLMLGAGSPALNKGLPLKLKTGEPPATDIAGTPVPQGKGIDLGAYERK